MVSASTKPYDVDPSYHRLSQRTAKDEHRTNLVWSTLWQTAKAFATVKPQTLALVLTLVTCLGSCGIRRIRILGLLPALMPQDGRQNMYTEHAKYTKQLPSIYGESKGWRWKRSKPCRLPHRKAAKHSCGTAFA